MKSITIHILIYHGPVEIRAGFYVQIQTAKDASQFLLVSLLVCWRKNRHLLLAWILLLVCCWRIDYTTWFMIPVS